MARETTGNRSRLVSQSTEQPWEKATTGAMQICPIALLLMTTLLLCLSWTTSKLQIGATKLTTCLHKKKDSPNPKQEQPDELNYQPSAPPLTPPTIKKNRAPTPPDCSHSSQSHTELTQPSLDPAKQKIRDPQKTITIPPAFMLVVLLIALLSQTVGTNSAIHNSITRLPRPDQNERTKIEQDELQPYEVTSCQFATPSPTKLLPICFLFMTLGPSNPAALITVTILTLANTVEGPLINILAQVTGSQAIADELKAAMVTQVKKEMTSALRNKTNGFVNRNRRFHEMLTKQVISWSNNTHLQL